MQLLHISDLHNKPEAIKRLEYIEKHYPNHHIIDTGDSTDNGNIDEYVWNLHNVIVPFGKRLFAVPGNHSVGWKGNGDTLDKLEAFDFYYQTSFATSKEPAIKELPGKVVLIGLNSNPGTWWFWRSPAAVT